MAGIAVAVLPDAGPPQVGITVTGLSSTATSVITVEDSWDGGVTWHGVRGAVAVAVIGATFIRDHVPPLNLPVTYRLTVVSGPTVPDTLTAVLTVPSALTWVQDPLDPHNAFPVRAASMGPTDVTLTQGSLVGATWAQQVDLAVPQGARLPVASIGRRLLAAEVPLVLSHDVAATATAVRDLLLSSGQVVIRGLPTPNLLDAVAFCTVGDVTETRLGSRVAISSWALRVRQVRPTGLSIVIPWWTYADVKAIWAPATYAEAVAARPGATYLDWQRSPVRP